MNWTHLLTKEQKGNEVIYLLDLHHIFIYLHYFRRKLLKRKFQTSFDSL